MKKIHYTYLKPQNYYFKLLILFSIITLILTSIIFNFQILNKEEFLLKFIIILFLIIFISVLIEYNNKSEYLNPIEILNLEIFILDFLKNINFEIKFDKYFNKYDFKSKNKLKKISEKKFKFYISSISKKTINNDKNIYTIKITNKNKILKNILFGSFINYGNFKLYIKNDNKSYKIIRIE